MWSFSRCGGASCFLDGSADSYWRKERKVKLASRRWCNLRTVGVQLGIRGVLGAAAWYNNGGRARSPTPG